MLVRLASAFLLLVGTAPLLAQEKPEKIVKDTWHAAYLAGHHSGWVHNITREVVRDGKKVLRTQSDFELHVARESDTVRLHMLTGTEETPDGKVTGVFMIQDLSPTQQLKMTGIVVGSELIVKTDNGDGKITTATLPWNDANLGLFGQDQMFKDRRVKSGDQFGYQSFEPIFRSVFTLHVQVKNRELVKTLTGTKNLLRVELVSDKLKSGNDEVGMPPQTLWLDEKYDTIRSDFLMESLGQVAVYRTTEAIAKKLPAGRPAVNIGLNSLVPLNGVVPINRPYDAEEVVYRITVKDDDHPETTFAREARQSVRKLAGNTIELVVHATPARNLGAQDPEPGTEFLESNYFVNSDDERVRAHTRHAVGPTEDPWQKALNIERYVHDVIKDKTYTEAFATSAEVARNLKGDCTEHAVLAAAMCRAAGIPSRTALGLLYVDHAKKGAVMGFHMWAEVWVNGHWQPIDGVMGRGFVGATHLKVSDQSWHDIQSLTPLLPVYRVLGKLEIEVMSVQLRGQR
jgi:hypothetical protein